MITGIIKSGHPTVKIIFRLLNQPDFTIEFVIDTGFTGDLSLPPAAVNVMDLPFLYELPANLANNTWVDIPIHEAVILWNREERVVNVLATGRRPLLGTGLLDGYELTVQFTEGGLITIDDL